MGKYQLDYKGLHGIEKFHEKNSTVKTDQKSKIEALKKKHEEKKKS
ncbi:MAG: hypothetical protein LBI11_05910 [Streptococcaceae bacterium]|jgi:hypothetical protein|nr:hypothetical protein [Streptococcaceae bacterium]